MAPFYLQSSDANIFLTVLLGLLLVAICFLYFFPERFGIRREEENALDDVGEDVHDVLPAARIYGRPFRSPHQVPSVMPDFLPNDVGVPDEPATMMMVVPRFRRRQSSESSAEECAETEALTSVQMALKMRQMGKLDKALKLFQHALALQPCHPEVLNHYGEFLEEKGNDVIGADHLYLRALSLAPCNGKALLNRERTLPLVETLDREELGRIDRKLAELSHINLNSAKFKKMKKEIYFLHIYHTVAIEGNTMSPSEMQTVIETKNCVYGKSITEHNEVLGLESALQYMNKTFVNHPLPLSLFDILQIHKRVLGFVDPYTAGTLRQQQVFVGDHIPPPPSEVEALMVELTDWLESEGVVGLHPVKRAALAHYKLAHIHPFLDGNGRTSRLIMNLVLMKAGFPPIIVRKQDRGAYVQALRLANDGDVRPFVRFIARCTECMLDVYLRAKECDRVCLRYLQPSKEFCDVISL